MTANTSEQINPLQTGTSGTGRIIPIWFCVNCHSKELQIKNYLFGLLRARYSICTECGTKFRRVGDKYKLVRVADRRSFLWEKYGGKTLSS
jgi:hypothetical protein